MSVCGDIRSKWDSWIKTKSRDEIGMLLMSVLKRDLLENKEMKAWTDVGMEADRPKQMWTEVKRLTDGRTGD